jgi:hypothetical protein
MAIDPAGDRVTSAVGPLLSAVRRQPIQASQRRIAPAGLTISPRREQPVGLIQQPGIGRRSARIRTVDR